MCLFKFKEDCIVNLTYVVTINVIENDDEESSFKVENFPYLLQLIFSNEIPLPVVLNLPFPTRDDALDVLNEIYRTVDETRDS